MSIPDGTTRRASGESFTKDTNQSDPRWPLREISETRELEFNNLDDQPNAQRIKLDCGHELINTYGEWSEKMHVRRRLRCRACWNKNMLGTPS